MSRHLLLLITFITLTISNCTLPNTTTPSFAQDVQPIFNSTCASAICHATATATNSNLNLSEGSAYTSLVNVASSGDPAKILVVPGDSANSYLYMKLTGAPGITGVQMPKVGFLSQNDLDVIKNWIDLGALNN